MVHILKFKIHSLNIKLEALHRKGLIRSVLTSKLFVFQSFNETGLVIYLILLKQKFILYRQKYFCLIAIYHLFGINI